jgi:hypothetical protein
MRPPAFAGGFFVSANALAKTLGFPAIRALLRGGTFYNYLEKHH